MNTLYTQLKRYGRVRANALLSRFTTYKIGGPARMLVEVTETDKLVGLLNFLTTEGVEYFILSGGTNLLMSDEGYDGVVIKVQSLKFKVQNNSIEVDAGVELKTLVELSLQHKLTGMEWAAGIPGSVGGAVRGNAGAMGSDTSRVVTRVTAWENGEVREWTNAECNFHYRDSVFKHNNAVVLSATYQLAESTDMAATMAAVQKNVLQRAARIPPEPSAGSFFKNVPVSAWKGDPNDLPELTRQRGKIPAGWLVEQLHIQGKVVGGAILSLQHGNYIVNQHNATQADVLAIVEFVKEAVYTKFGIELIPEVEIVN